MKMIFKMIKFLIFTTVSIVCLAEEVPEVRTNYGRLQGTYMRSRNGITFSGFLGVPFAAPPIGQLRFRSPVSPQSWQGVRIASEERDICSQGKYGGSEDCLYVNVFTPCVRCNPKLPVMFYIHGGSFYMGSPSLSITGPEYFMDRDVVLVTVRYRLGPFGFLSTEDSVIPGNMGLKDQLKALQWVQENIKHFGGDPDRVTLFSCSVGGSSVHMHMQSHKSENLFARGISQSGTASSSFSLMKRSSARASTVQLLQYVNCNLNSTEILQCIQEKSTAEIEEAHEYLQSLGYRITKSIFRPVLEENNEDAFLTSNPLLQPTIKPWLAGMTANEGILNIRLKYLDETINKIQSEFSIFGPKALLFYNICSKPNTIANRIFQFYFNNSSTTSQMVKSIEEMFTDWWTLFPLDQASKLHQGPLYQYVYNYRGEHSYTDIYDSPKISGVSHLDDLISLFNHSQYFQTLNHQDTIISKLMVDLWVNFATYGNPTPTPINRHPLNQNELRDFRWDPYTKDNPVHLHLEPNALSMRKGIYPNRLAFWSGLNVIDRYP